MAHYSLWAYFGVSSRVFYMELTNGQQLALQAIDEIGKSHPDGGGIVVIRGYAGCGKTTTLRTLAEDQDLTVLTPTGKAAVRVREIANVNALTVHRWLYDLFEDPDTGKLRYSLKNDVARPANKTIFIDEASMITFSMFRDLYTVARRCGLNLVFIGDGFQLPPVEFDEKYKDFSVLASDSPAHIRVHMTEVVRQALDNPIIRISMEIREMSSQLNGLSELPIVKPSLLAEVGAETFNNGGATICHRNVTRHKLNNEIRAQSGITSEYLEKGEPLLVTVNNYSLDVYNGEVLTANTKPVLLGDKPVAVSDRFANEAMNMWFYEVTIDTPAGPTEVLVADREIFGANGKISAKAIRKAGMGFSRHLLIEEMRKEGPVSYATLQTTKGMEVLNANLGYCLTAHKSQGSEWPEVLVCIEDSVRLHSMDGRRWLYTALTRSKDRVKIAWL
jgi:exodeoxyribonuclease-5